MNEKAVLHTSTSVLLIGSKNYSSWSLRPWLFLRKAGFKFREQLVYFDESDYRLPQDSWSTIAAVPPVREQPCSPNARV